MSPNSESRLDRARQGMGDALLDVMTRPGAPPMSDDDRDRLNRVLLAWAEWESAFTDHVTVILNAEAARERMRDRRLDALDDAVLGSRRTATHRPPGHSDPDDPTGRG